MNSDFSLKKQKSQDRTSNNFKYEPFLNNEKGLATTTSYLNAINEFSKEITKINPRITNLNSNKSK